MQTYLKHHGTKGQHWGVRHYQNHDGSLTPEGRIHYGVGQKRTASPDDISSKSYVTTIPKGSILYRTTPNKKENLKGSKYVTYFQSDRNMYRGPGADWIASINGVRYGNLREKQYKLKTDLKIPSREEMMKIYDETARKNSDKLVAAGKARAEWYLKNDNLDKGAVNMLRSIEDGSLERAAGKKAVDGLLEDKNISAWYSRYKAESVRKTDEIKNANLSDSYFLYSTAFGSSAGKQLKEDMISELKKRGYNAMTDEAGVGGHAGYSRETRQALIIFDMDEVAEEKKTKRLNERVYRKATSEYSEWYKEANKKEA